MQLEAESLGLGTVWIQMRKRFSQTSNSEEHVRKLLNIPENYGVVCLLAVGYKNETLRSYEYDDIDVSKAHYKAFKQ